MPSSTFQPLPPFLAGGGELGRLIAAFDWSRTTLGPLDQWPAHVRTATSLMLRSQVGMVMLWGEDGVMIYNDAYSVFSAGRHPQLLGSRVREGWPEVADFNDNVMKTGLAGETLSYQDQELTLHRNGRAEQVWMNLDYSPVLDDDGRPVGVMAIVVETTGKVQAERFAQGEHERLARLFDQAPSFVAVLDGPAHRFQMVNPNYMELVGQRPVLGLTVQEALPEVAGQGFLELLDRVYATGEPYSAFGTRYSRPGEDGQPAERYVDLVYQPIRNTSGEVTGIFAQGVDVTARIADEKRRDALALLTEKFRKLESSADIEYAAAEILGNSLQTSRVGYGTIDPEAETLHVLRDWTAPGVETLAGVVHLREYGSFIDSLKRDEFISIADVRADPRTAPAAGALEARSARAFVNVPVLEQGRLVAVLYVNNATQRHWSADDLAFIRDVAERTRTSAERSRAVAVLLESESRLREAVEARTRELMTAEAALRQSQKMEAIGQLTGGIAHDFNNLLAAISGSLQLLDRRLSTGLTDNAPRYIGMALGSVQRAAALTQRLLAFSRRQTLDPRAIDVNRLIAGLEDLIRRTVGPSVELEVVGAGGLWVVKADAPQLENALLNLCINARDAMAPAGGRLTIETANKWLDDRAAAERDVPPGQYISVCVTDTGTGMTPEVMARAFDPFFTTKPIGQGTGLGLSMIYGFVRQSGGQVRIYSELGKGTTMCLYLPRHMGDADSPQPQEAEQFDQHASGEVVLVIEDEDTIRALLTEELQGAGYRVMSASDGQAGLRMLQAEGRIDLLLTDVGLPGGLNGRQVADAARVSRPDLKVLFITGYAENAAVGNGLLAPGMEVITKPFDIAHLARKVRELIDRA